MFMGAHKFAITIHTYARIMVSRCATRFKWSSFRNNISHVPFANGGEILWESRKSERVRNALRDGCEKLLFLGAWNPATGMNFPGTISAPSTPIKPSIVQVIKALHADSIALARSMFQSGTCTCTWIFFVSVRRSTTNVFSRGQKKKQHNANLGVAHFKIWNVPKMLKQFDGTRWSISHISARIDR